MYVLCGRCSLKSWSHAAFFDWLMNYMHGSVPSPTRISCTNLTGSVAEKTHHPNVTPRTLIVIRSIPGLQPAFLRICCHTEVVASFGPHASQLTCNDDKALCSAPCVANSKRFPGTYYQLTVRYEERKILRGMRRQSPVNHDHSRSLD
jgi:hypothetical protein